MSTEWRMVSLAECAQLDLGYPFKSADYTDSDDGVRLLRGDNIGQGQLRWDGVRKWLRKEGDKLSNYELRENDLVLAMDRPWITAGLKYARVRRGDIPSILVQRVARLRPKEGVDADFLHSVIASPDFTQHIQTITTGTAVPHISGTQIKEYKFNLPDVATQRAIGSLLIGFDDRITLLRETNATLEAMAQALFKSWFVDFDPVRAKMESCSLEGMDDATASLFPDGLEETALGLVPRGWRIGPIGESISVVDFVANGSFASLKENVTLHNVPSYALYLRTTDFNSGYSGDFRYVDRSAFEFLAKSSLDGTEVVISNVGDVGTVFRPPTWLGLPMTLGSNAVALKAHGLSAFMYLYFNGAKGQHDIQSIVTGSAQLKFNKTNFRSLLIALPEAAVLQRFESIAGALLSTIDNNLAMIKTLATLRDTLLPRMISGQLRVASEMPDLEGIN